MARRSGTADLPLHGGHVPRWLSERMARLGRVIIEAIHLHYGRQEVLRRLSHPFWFQAFGAVMGMDWHSSGITTSVIGALQRGLAPVEDELGIFVRGGRGARSRSTPEELLALGERLGLDGAALARTSRLVAKVDSALVQDGHQLYLHAFIAAADGAWSVVQQGMNPALRQARRYHWRSEGLRSFVDDPHQGIDGQPAGEIINLADRRAQASRSAQLSWVHLGPDAILRELAAIADPRDEPLPQLSLPHHHEVRAEDVSMRRLRGALAAAAEAGPETYEALALVPGIGARTLESLALVAEVTHGAPHRFTDPARFSAAHGGKDGHPFPVPLAVYDDTIRVLKSAVERAKLGQDDKLAALQRLDQRARALESPAGPTWDEHVADERAAAARRGGKTVFDAPKGARKAAKKKQLGLFE
ncbi:MAG: DUF763 domain-containing protein [Myxococcota bacterium]